MTVLYLKCILFLYLSLSSGDNLWFTIQQVMKFVFVDYNSWFTYLICWISKFSSKEKFFAVYFRSSRSQMFFKIGVLKTFAKFTVKHLCWSLFLIKNFTKKRLQHKCFHVNITKFIRTAFFLKHLQTAVSVS